MSDNLIACSHCGGEEWYDDLVDGKCVSCIVNDCHHSNVEEVDSDREYKEPKITIHYVCMDCEVNWSVSHKLDQGIKSKLTHEDCNECDIDENPNY